MSKFQGDQRKRRCAIHRACQWDRLPFYVSFLPVIWSRLEIGSHADTNNEQGAPFAQGIRYDILRNELSAVQVSCFIIRLVFLVNVVLPEIFYARQRKYPHASSGPACGEEESCA